MKPTAIIVSLNFNPGHISHLIAYYKQMEELGFTSLCYVNRRFLEFLPENVNALSSDSKVIKCEAAVITFPSLHNLRLIQSLRKQATKIFYIFHEPLAPFRYYRKSGFSYKYLAKLRVIDYINSLTVRWSNHIFIPSHKGIDYYHKNALYKNSNVTYMPLLYDDETIGTIPLEREYISYIGTVAADHSFNEFLKYVEVAVERNLNPGYSYLIATKSEFNVPDKLAASPRVKIIKGKPLTNEEINRAYASSLLVWNAYVRTTQSGVLAKSYMFGTPALVMKHNLNEFMIDGETVASIHDNHDVNEIQESVDELIRHFGTYSANCRDMFLNNFYYRKHNDLLKSVLNNRAITNSI